ncbi:MAG: PP2C family protein-serine/threonine phosphatase [Anaerolineales bacterium]
MEARVAVAKVAKYATSESGDTLEMIERPGGGVSFVLADGQRSGRSAKAISNVVTRKAISLLAEGVRDGAAARAASDYLYTYRGGKVLATLKILSIDLQTGTMVITRNGPSPVLVIEDGDIRVLDDDVLPVGIRRSIRPVIEEIPLSDGLTAILYTDGLTHAGSRQGQALDVEAAAKELLAIGRPDPPSWADHLMQRALDLDQSRPVDDISILVASVGANQNGRIRRLDVRLPL